jgi:uncharacterized repeat protein (TIGR01451 family)
LKGYPVIRSKLRFVIIGFFLFVMIQQVLAGTPIDVGWIDHSFAAAGVVNPSAEKPQSKLWFQDGLWWGALYEPSASAFTIHRFDWATDTWINTSTVIDAREDAYIDTLWDGSRLYTISHGISSGTAADSAEVRRYSYNSLTQTYSLDAGFPVTVSTGGMEAAVIAKDSTNTLWITFTQNGDIYVSHSNGADNIWVAPYILPFVSEADAQVDDISSIIRFGGNKIGVMWSNQNTEAFYFAVHVDGTADTLWTLEIALQGPYIADDHINLKTDSAGRIYAAVKTSVGDNPAALPTESLVRLLVRQPSAAWAWYNVGRVSESHTRPLVLIDEATASIFVFATLPTGSSTQGEIRYKESRMSSIAFVEGAGTQFIYNSAHEFINNVSSTKQNITCASGVLVIADDNGNNFYHHNKGPCGLGVVLPPTPTKTPSAVSATGVPALAVFDPAISKIGFLLPGQVGVTGEVLEWIVTVTNTSNVAGQNVTITDVIDSRLQIDSVDAPNAQVTINGQTVSVTYASLNPGETVMFSIFTTVLDGLEVENTACVNALNQAAEECAIGRAISQLPSTGISPWSHLRILFFIMTALLFLVSSYLFIRKQMTHHKKRDQWIS